MRRSLPRGVRVLIVSMNYAPERTGIAPYSSALALSLSGESQVASSRVIAAHPHYPQWDIWPGFGAWKDIRCEDDVAVRRLLHYVPKKPTSVRRGISELSFAVRVIFAGWGRPDVVVAVSPSLFGAAGAVLRCKVFRVPIVTWVQDLYGAGVTERGGRLSALVSRAFYAVEQATFRNSDRVVVIHDRFREQLLRNHNRMDANSVEVVRNWTRTAQFEFQLDRETERSRLGWNDKFVVVHTGAQGRKQGLDRLLLMAEEIAPSHPDVLWVLIGNGSERSKLERLASGKRFVEIWDPLPNEEYAAVLEASDAFVVCEAPGVAEAAVPSKLTTYFRANGPVLGVLDPSSVTWSEIYTSGGGLTVRHSTEELSSAIDSLKKSSQLSQSLSEKGRRYCSSVLDADTNLSKLSKIVLRAARRRGSSA